MKATKKKNRGHFYSQSANLLVSSKATLVSSPFGVRIWMLRVFQFTSCTFAVIQSCPNITTTLLGLHSRTSRHSALKHKPDLLALKFILRDIVAIGMWEFIPGTGTATISGPWPPLTTFLAGFVGPSCNMSAPCCWFDMSGPYL